MSTVYNFQYQAPSGNVYSGQVATDASTPYNYQPGQQIPYDGGTYVIGTESYQSNAAAGTVYCTNYYDAATNRNYDSYHYDPAHNQYYNVTQKGYDRATGTY